MDKYKNFKWHYFGGILNSHMLKDYGSFNSQKTKERKKNLKTLPGIYNVEESWLIKWKQRQIYLWLFLIQENNSYTITLKGSIFFSTSFLRHTHSQVILYSIHILKSIEPSSSIHNFYLIYYIISDLVIPKRAKWCQLKMLY